MHPILSMSNKRNNARTFEAPTNAIVLDLVRIRRSVSSLLRKGGGGVLPDMVAKAVVAILQRILCGQGCAGQGLVELSSGSGGTSILLWRKMSRIAVAG